MVHTLALTYVSMLALLEVLPRAIAHGHGNATGEAADMDMGVSTASSAFNSTPSPSMYASSGLPESYFAYPHLSGWMTAHIAVMTAAWFFILPIGEQISAQDHHHENC